MASSVDDGGGASSEALATKKKKKKTKKGAMVQQQSDETGGALEPSLAAAEAAEGQDAAPSSPQDLRVTGKRFCATSKNGTVQPRRISFKR